MSRKSDFKIRELIGNLGSFGSATSKSTPEHNFQELVRKADGHGLEKALGGYVECPEEFLKGHSDRYGVRKGGRSDRYNAAANEVRDALTAAVCGPKVQVVIPQTTQFFRCPDGKLLEMINIQDAQFVKCPDGSLVPIDTFRRQIKATQLTGYSGASRTVEFWICQNPCCKAPNHQDNFYCCVCEEPCMQVETAVESAAAAAPPSRHVSFGSSGSSGGSGGSGGSRHPNFGGGSGDSHHSNFGESRHPNFGGGSGNSEIDNWIARGGKWTSSKKQVRPAYSIESAIRRHGF
jgi:hypothetical protein